MMIEIDKNVPIPIGKARRENYPFSKMEVGDSFLFASRSRQNAYQCVFHANARHAPKRFITRATEEGRHRCWRIT
jgi:hypothetical protein